MNIGLKKSNKDLVYLHMMILTQRTSVIRDVIRLSILVFSKLLKLTLLAFFTKIENSCQPNELENKFKFVKGLLN